jgi:DNA-binding response OmpR family regulator
MPEAPIALIIDADRGFGNAIREILEMKGFYVFRAYDSLGAVSLLESLHPDLILLDVTMSEINGLAFIQGIRTDPHSANTKVIVMSARMTKEEKAAAMEA